MHTDQCCLAGAKALNWTKSYSIGNNFKLPQRARYNQRPTPILSMRRSLTLVKGLFSMSFWLCFSHRKLYSGDAFKKMLYQNKSVQNNYIRCIICFLFRMDCVQISPRLKILRKRIEMTAKRVTFLHPRVSNVRYTAEKFSIHVVVELTLHELK